MRTDRTRVTYRPDQCLASGDLAAQSATQAELLALHQARVHDTWGIVTGFGCSLDGDRVVVAPGLGLDALGRTVLLSGERRLPVPADGGALLVATWAGHSGVDGCAPAGLPAEEPVLRWRRAAERQRVGTELPLVLLRRRGETASLDPSVRKVAHALVRPKVATGRVQRSSAPVQGTYGNWTMWVPTWAGGLSSPAPVYFVTLDQHPWGELADFGSTKPPPVQQRLAEWVGPFVAVEAAASSGFSLRVSGRLGTWREGQYPEPGTNPVGLSWIGIDTTYGELTFLRFLDQWSRSFVFGGVQ